MSIVLCLLIAEGFMHQIMTDNDWVTDYLQLLELLMAVNCYIAVFDEGSFTVLW